jgi:hypothetical protein
MRKNQKQYEAIMNSLEEMLAELSSEEMDLLEDVIVNNCGSDDGRNIFRLFTRVESRK